MDLPTVLAPLVTATLTGAAVWLRERKQERLRRSVPLAATAQLRQSEILTDLATHLSCSRALLACVHNGGSVPHGGSDLKMTVLAESEPPPGVRRVSSEFQGRPITDPEHRRLICEVDRHEMRLVYTTDLEPGTMLADEYQRAGLLSVWFVLVRPTAKTWYYLSCSSKHVMSPSADARATLRGAASKLARLCVQDLDLTLDDPRG